MQIKLSSLLVDDQDKALAFYTEKLGFIPKTDVPVGDFRWITVVSPDDPDGTELVLEPNANPVGKTYQTGLRKQGIPQTAFLVDDIQAEFARLSDLGVTFTLEPTEAGPVTIALLDDTCGNLVQIFQYSSRE